MSENESTGLENVEQVSKEDNGKSKKEVSSVEISSGKWGKRIKKGNVNIYKFNSVEEVTDINGIVVYQGLSYKRLRKKDNDSEGIVTLELIGEQTIRFRKEDFEENFGIKREKVERKQRGISFTDAENKVQQEKLTPLVRDEHYLKILQSCSVEDIKLALSKLAEQKTS